MVRASVPILLPLTSRGDGGCACARAAFKPLKRQPKQPKEGFMLGGVTEIVTMQAVPFVDLV
jgi:hypothetical protein